MVTETTAVLTSGGGVGDSELMDLDRIRDPRRLIPFRRKLADKGAHGRARVGAGDAETCEALIEDTRTGRREARDDHAIGFSPHETWLLPGHAVQRVAHSKPGQDHRVGLWRGQIELRHGVIGDRRLENIAHACGLEYAADCGKRLTVCRALIHRDDRSAQDANRAERGLGAPASRRRSAQPEARQARAQATGTGPSER
jgi:hypothetical protein